MNDKLLIVYNICGISGREDVNYYVDCLESLLNQTDNKNKIAISGCLNRQAVKEYLRERFQGRVIFNFIDEKLPVNVTFNRTVQRCVQEYGHFKGYLYVDSGINLAHDLYAIQKLSSIHNEGKYAMVASRTDTDAGTFLWFNKGKDHYDESGQEVLFKDKHLEIPIGKTVNLHCQIFDNELFLNFDNRLMPDIFASYCTESVFSYLCAAIGKKFIVSKNVIARHVVGMDGASSGFSPKENSFPPWQHTFIAPAPDTILNLISNPEAKESGLGYEECQNILPHDPSKYNEDGSCKDPERLKKFIKDNLFLNELYLNYKNISCEFTSL